MVSCELTNGKKVMNHLRSNKDIGKTKETMSRTHGGDRKARPVTNHDGRTRGVWGSDREDTGMRCGVEGGTRVGDPLGADRRRPPHGAEGLREQGSSSGEHGRRLRLRAPPDPEMATSGCALAMER